MKQEMTLGNTWNNKIKIRPIKKEDLPGLEWNGEFTHFRRVYADAYQRVLSGLSLIWVLDMEGVGIIGQLFIQLNCDRPELADGKNKAYMYAFRIQPTYRDHGLGSMMMAQIEKDLRKRGYKSLTLNVAKDNILAQKLYKRLGFSIINDEPGIWSYPDEKGVWQQVHEPAWRMEKPLF